MATGEEKSERKEEDIWGPMWGPQFCLSEGNEMSLSDLKPCGSNSRLTFWRENADCCGHAAPGVGGLVADRHFTG